ncbi:MAG: VWA domain-containing protein [Bacteroidota bacterium]
MQVLILPLLLAFVIASGLSFLQYFYRGKRTKLTWILSVLRFVALFCGILLLINPKFSKEEYELENANLIVLADNSSSVKKLKGAEEAKQIVANITDHPQLNAKFTVKRFAFGSALENVDTLDFSAKRTNIAKSLETLDETFANAQNIVLLVSDGNQTVGEDFEFLRLGTNTTVFPVIVGDTTTYNDIAIGQVNVNRYAFLGNTFPVEAEVIYSGEIPANVNFQLFLDGKIVHREPLQFARNERVKTVSALVEATSTGIKTLAFRISPLENEKNVDNNTQQRFVEVIDEQTTIGMVSAIRHPDIGALKEAIETNEQRSVVLLDPTAPPEAFEDIDVFLLYQPDRSFASVYDVIGYKGGGVFTITGPETDWDFLQSQLSTIRKEDVGQQEVISAVKNEAFDLFDISEFTMLDYPPVSGELGDLEVPASAKVIAYQKIRGVTLEAPLFFVLEDERKEAFLLGADVWKWRSQSYRNSGGFEAFDTFLGKLLLYLSDSEQKERLRLNYENRYDNSRTARITASFFDNTYVFDPNASLVLKIISRDTTFEREETMLLRGNRFELDLGDLEPGEYRFTVREIKENISKSGSFSILDFDLEDQFLSANDAKLKRLAEANGGQHYFPDQSNQMLEELLADDRFIPVQKSNKNVVSLIDFRWLLGLMALALALEWAIRKYNGLL